MNILLRILSDFPFGLMAGEMLEFRSFRKKPYFTARALLTGFPFCLLYAVVAQNHGESITNLSIFLSKTLIAGIMLLSCLWLRFCYQAERKDRVFCMIFAYAIQNIHHNIYINGRILAEGSTRQLSCLASWI